VLRAAAGREARCFAVGTAIGCLVLGFVLTAAARADGPVLRESNLGQSSAPVEVAQPPFDVVATASCAYTFTVANEGACPAGTWPPLGQAWGQIEDVAGGDILRLEFSTPVSSVAVSSTSNYQPGLHDPSGNAIPNYDVLAESPATGTGDPAVWSATLPQLDARATSPQGYTFSVVAHDELGYHDYPFGIRSPRYANEQTRCGGVFYSTGVEVGQCGQEWPKAPPQELDIAGARYDGRLLTLKVRVPGPGELSLAVPVVCGRARAAECRKRTTISRRVAKKGELVLKKRLVPRLDSGHRLNLSARMEMDDGDLIVTALRPRVHFLTSSP
jgi:hypothetical protein